MAELINITRDNGMSVDQAERDRLPDHNSRARREKRSAVSWRAVAFVLVVAAIVGVGFAWWLAQQWAYMTLYHPVWAEGVRFVLVIGVPIGAVVGAFAWAWVELARRRIVRLENDHPVDVFAVQSGVLSSHQLGTLQAHYSVQGVWAQQSGLRSLNQLDLSGKPASAPTMPAALEAATSALLPVAPPEWLRWVDSVPHVILAAETGGGKSTTAKAILAPRIAAQEQVFIIDPHSSAWFDLPSVGGGEDWPAVKQAMGIVYDEYQRRLAERDAYLRSTGQELPLAHFTRLTVLLDEANNARAALDSGKRGEVTAWQRFAQALGSGARKVRISVVLLCQSANVDDLGISGPMRENFTRVALDTSAARKLIASDEPNAERRRALYAALEGRDYPAVAEFKGVVHLLDRTGLDRTPPANAGASAWPAGYAAMQTAQMGETEPLHSGIAHSARDKAIIAMFAKGMTYDDVRDCCKQFGIAVDQNRFPELRAAALGR